MMIIIITILNIKIMIIIIIILTIIFTHFNLITNLLVLFLTKLQFIIY